MIKDRSAGGLRRSPFMQLTDGDIEQLLNDIDMIGADRDVFLFNIGFQTGYSDETGFINIR